MLGVLKAGGAYVPLDPAYPRERLGYMLQDAAVDARHHRRRPWRTACRRARPRCSCWTASVRRDRGGVGRGAARATCIPENLSHVIFTSGSTGRPKGVMIRHPSAVVLLHWLRETITDAERASVLFSTSINFDVSVAEIFGTLCWGGKLVLVENALDLATLDEPVVHVQHGPQRGGGAAAQRRHPGRACGR